MKYPDAFQRPQETEEREGICRRAGCQNDWSRFARIADIDGDFFTSVPADADAYILRWIIHDWADSPAIGDS